MNKTKQNTFWIPILLFSFIIIWIIFYNNLEITKKSASKGKLNLSDWDENSVIEIRGEWQFFDGLMIKHINNANKLEYRNIPDFFEHGDGTSTYKLVINGLDQKHTYGVQISDISSAYRLVINGIDVLSSGAVSYSREGYYPQNEHKVGVFRLDGDKAEILIEISNFSYYEGGFSNFVKLGTLENILSYTSKQAFIDLFIFVSLMIIGVVYLLIFTMLQDFKALLYFALLCIVIAFRTIVTNQNIIHTLISNVSWDFQVRLEFLTGYLMFPLFGLFVDRLAFTDIKSKRRWLYYFLVIIFSFLALILPHEIYASVLLPYIRFVQLYMIYYAYLIFQGIKKKNKDEFFTTIDILFLLVGIIYEFYIASFIPVINNLIFGIILIITTILAYILRLKYDKIIDQQNFLTLSLEEEKIFYKDLSRHMKVKNEFVENSTRHFCLPIKDVINLAEKSISSLEEMENIQNSSKNQTENPPVNIEENLGNILLKMRELLNLITEFQEMNLLKYKDSRFNEEKINVKQLIDPIIENFVITNKNYKVKIINEVEESCDVFSDENITKEIFYNIIETSINNTSEGYVRVFSKEFNDSVIITIEDTGILLKDDSNLSLGIKDLKLDIDIDKRVQNFGLIISKYLIEIQGEELIIESNLDIGNRFIFAMKKASNKKQEAL